RQEREAALVMRVDELVHRRRHLRENAEPAERICALERLSRNRLPADAVEAVAAGDRVALQLAARVADDAADRVDALDGRVEVERQSALEPRVDQVLDDLGLPVDDDPAPDELLHRDVVARAVELEMDAAVRNPLGV